MSNRGRWKSLSLAIPQRRQGGGSQSQEPLGRTADHVLSEGARLLFVATASGVRRAPARRAWGHVLRAGGDVDLLVAATVLLWLPLILALDRGAALSAQRLFGVATWLLLLGLARREPRDVRAQIALVVVFATTVEYTFSALLQVYVYRLGNVPAFVPPGHGLVYLAALCLGRSRCFRTHERGLVVATVVVGGAYAGWGLLFAARPDMLGAFWFACLLGFLRWGRSALLYVGAFLVVTFLELLGTRLGTWRWHEVDPSGLVTIGNPPSGAAGGYGWFDLAAVTGSPALLRLVTRTSGIRKPAGSETLRHRATNGVGPRQTSLADRRPTGQRNTHRRRGDQRHGRVGRCP